MKKTRPHMTRWPGLAAFSLIVALMPALVPAPRADETSISIDHPRVRVTIPGRPAAGYMMVRNIGKKADAIISASSAQAERVEFHTHLMEGGIMRMRQVEKVDVPASGEVAFRSGGHHLMIFGLKPDVKPGASISMTLTFKKAGEMQLDFPVEGIGSKGRAKAEGHSGHKHKH